MRESLQALWLSDKEARVYEVLSGFESLTASSIARHTGVKRASMYELLYALEKQNLIGHFQKNGTAYFYIDTPEKLIFQHQAKLKIAEELVRDIRSKKQKNTVSLEIYRDKEGFRELYREILLESGREFCAWSNFESFHRLIDPIDDKRWTAQRVQRGTRPRLLLVDNDVSRAFQREDSQYPRMTKLISAKKNFSSTLVISGTTIYLFDDQPEAIALKISHPNIAMMLQEIFDTYWQDIR